MLIGNDQKSSTAAPGRLAGCRQAGFTLLELMTVVAVIGIMSAIGMSYWQGRAMEHSRLHDAGVGIVHDIVATRAFARAQGVATSIVFGKDCEDAAFVGYAMNKGDRCAEVPLPEGVEIGFPSANGTAMPGPPTRFGGQRNHGVPNVLLNETVVFNPRGFVPYPIDQNSDTLYLHFVKDDGEISDHFGYAVVISPLGLPQLWRLTEPGATTWELAK